MLGIGENINSDAEFVGKLRGRKVGPGIIKGVEAVDLEILEAN